jgi:hypothetical protein
MHALLNFLEDLDVYLQGWGTQLILEVSLVSSKLAPVSCWRYSCFAAVGCARHLWKTAKAVQAGAVVKDCGYARQSLN